MPNKIALVTGGTRGIGRAITLELAQSGCLVYAGYHANDDVAQQWLATLTRQGIDNIRLLKGDVGHESIRDKIQDIIHQHGKIDILVNNAGITDHNTFEHLSYTQWNNVIKTNVDSLFYVTQPVYQSMQKNRFGRIINISSVNGQKGQKGEVNYSLSKAAMLGFSKALAQEAAEYNITVNTVSPGYVDTELTDKEALRDIMQQVPVKRLGYASEIAKAVAYLAADSSSFITGSDIAINGGLYMS